MVLPADSFRSFHVFETHVNSHMKAMGWYLPFLEA
jgi:hypothetical protein